MSVPFTNHLTLSVGRAPCRDWTLQWNVALPPVVIGRRGGWTLMSIRDGKMMVTGGGVCSMWVNAASVSPHITWLDSGNRQRPARTRRHWKSVSIRRERKSTHRNCFKCVVCLTLPVTHTTLISTIDQFGGTPQRGSLSYLGYNVLRMTREDTRRTPTGQYKNNQNYWIHPSLCMCIRTIIIPTDVIAGLAVTKYHYLPHYKKYPFPLKSTTF